MEYIIYVYPINSKLKPIISSTGCAAAVSVKNVVPSNKRILYQLCCLL